MTLAAATLVFGLAIAAWAVSTPSWEGIDRDLAQRYPGVARISAGELLDRLRGPHPPTLLDVRSADEFAVSHLPSARRVEPGASDAAGATADDEIVVYCSVGDRSSAFAARLQARGYRRVADLRGGIFGWANAGLPLERDGRAVQGVHPYDRRWGRLLARERWQWTPGD